MRYTLALPERQLTINRWEPSTPGQRVYDARSDYVERFWLGAIGPSTMCLLRHIASELETKPAFVMHYDEVGQLLGVKGEGRNSPLLRALCRLEMFRLGRLNADNTFSVRVQVPPVSPSLVRRMTPLMAQQHQIILARPAETDALAS